MFRQILQAGMAVCVPAVMFFSVATARHPASQIAAAPAFSAEQLLAPPTENWTLSCGNS